MKWQIKYKERVLIEAYRKQWFSPYKIWQLLHRHHTSIIRELERNWKVDDYWVCIDYNAEDAEKRASIRRFNANHKRTKLLKNHRLRKLIYDKLSDESKIWSPDNIAWRLRNERGISISATTIYNFAHNAWPTWENFLRYKWSWYRKRWTEKSKRFEECTSIHEREEVVNNRERIWDYEWDSVVWSWSCILWVLHERKSRRIIISKLPTWEAVYTTYNIVEKLKWANTLTVDRWSEFAYWSVVENKLWIKVYMTDPYSSWQKWWIERNNRELRQYFPKWISFDDIPQEKIKQVEERINNKPRKELWYKTSDEVFYHKDCKLL